jgi:uncharacterized membrane protein YfcA
MELWQVILLTLTGCVAGFLNVMAGGGSLLSMPVLVFIGMKGPLANGTNRIAILAQNVTATSGFFRQGFSDFKLSLSLSLCALPGAALGAYLGTKLGGVWFNRVLACVMVSVMILMWKRKKGRPAENKREIKATPKRVLAAHLLMVGAGIYGGFIQAGVGFILMAVLHRVLGLDLVRVNMHKVFIVGVYTLLALFIFASKGQVVWSGGCFLAIGTAAGGWVAARVAIKEGEGLIRLILNVVLVAMALKLLLTY